MRDDDDPGAPPEITVLIVEDDEALRRDFARTIDDAPGLRVLATAGTAREAERRLRDGPVPTVMLTDIGLPDGDGIALVGLLRELAPDARSLVISVFADEQHVVRALAAGARGYVLKDAPADEIVRAIRDVDDGSAPLSPRVARYLLQQFAPTAAAAPVPAERLTAREAEVLTLIARGQQGTEVARRLGLSPHTVTTHLRNCYAKLAARNRVEAVNRARDTGQID